MSYGREEQMLLRIAGKKREDKDIGVFCFPAVCLGMRNVVVCKGVEQRKLWR